MGERDHTEYYTPSTHRVCNDTCVVWRRCGDCQCHCFAHISTRRDRPPTPPPTCGRDRDRAHVHASESFRAFTSLRVPIDDRAPSSQPFFIPPPVPRPSPSSTSSTLNLPVRAPAILHLPSHPTHIHIRHVCLRAVLLPGQSRPAPVAAVVAATRARRARGLPCAHGRAIGARGACACH